MGYISRMYCTLGIIAYVYLILNWVYRTSQNKIYIDFSTPKIYFIVPQIIYFLSIIIWRFLAYLSGNPSYYFAFECDDENVEFFLLFFMFFANALLLIMIIYTWY